MRFLRRSRDRLAHEPTAPGRQGPDPGRGSGPQRRPSGARMPRAALRPESADGAGSEHDPTGTRVLRLSRLRCDDEDLRRLRDFCRQCVRPGRRRVVLDLSRVRRADTRLVAMLVYVLRLARRAHVRLELRLSPELDALLDLCGVRHLLEATQRPDAGPAGPSRRRPE